VPQPTTFQDAASILAARFCMKPIIVEGVLRELDPDSPVRAVGQLITMPPEEASQLLFQYLWQMPMQTLVDAPWG